MNKRILSILVENTAGVLSRVSGLFSRRGYNIDSLSAGITTDPNYTRMTVVCKGDELILEQITRQVEKLEDVLSVKVLKDEQSVTRELMLVKGQSFAGAAGGDYSDCRYFQSQYYRCGKRVYDCRAHRK